jgi:acyl-coenzyme A synthetase/AMP-(fatty) acid ligase
MLYAHPSVLEVAIISTKDARRGESVKAVVGAKQGAPPIEQASFIAWCQERMAAYKVPRSVEVVSALPKTGSGKIMWRALQEEEDRRAAG